MAFLVGGWGGGGSIQLDPHIELSIMFIIVGMAFNVPLFYLCFQVPLWCQRASTQEDGSVLWV